MSVLALLSGRATGRRFTRVPRQNAIGQGMRKTQGGYWQPRGLAAGRLVQVSGAATRGSVCSLARVKAIRKLRLPFFSAMYSSQFRNRHMEERPHPFLSWPLAGSWGKALSVDSSRFDSARCRKAANASVASESKYPHGNAGYVSRSRLRKRLTSLRYSLNRVTASYSGCP